MDIQFLFTPASIITTTHLREMLRYAAGTNPNDRFRMLKHLFAACDAFRPLAIARQQQDEAAVVHWTQLIVNYQDRDNNTALHKAIAGFYGASKRVIAYKAKIIRDLTTLGADWHIPNNIGDRPIDGLERETFFKYDLARPSRTVEQMRPIYNSFQIRGY